MNLQSLFTALENLESNVAALYKLYSEFYATDPEAAQLFYKLALDEKSHVNVIQYEKRLYKQNPKLFREVDLDMEEIRQACELVKVLRSAREAPALKQAVRSALEVEDSAAEHHFRLALREFNPEVARVLMSMGTADKQHGDTLRAFAQARGFLGPQSKAST
jgi:rubrerythrin